VVLVLTKLEGLQRQSFFKLTEHKLLGGVFVWASQQLLDLESRKPKQILGSAGQVRSLEAHENVCITGSPEA
jgi:hypothetical protein